MTEWERTKKQMDEMIRLDAPAVIKAHYVVNVLIPRLAKLVGVKDFSHELSRFLCRGVAQYTGICVQCLKDQAVRGEDFCPRCLAEYDQFEASLEGDGT